jgi:hypothetical protein
MSQKAENAAENARKIRTQLQTVENARAPRILGALGALVMTAAAVYALPYFNHTRAMISHVALDDKATSPQSKGTTGSGDDADSGGNASQLSTWRRNWWGSK